ncbi:MAG: asparagine--tRNA ligase [Candidatus Gastranaerophilales bacterium]|nr:asparagine--tRNA ligase [Candidatus Gastranaerophilales bacterium]
MDRVLIKNLGQFEGQDVIIKGWLYNKRSSGKLHFLQIRDGSAEVQAVVFKGDVSDEMFEAADKITQESSVEILGTVKKHDRSKLGYELSVKEVKVIGESVDYPITPKEHGVDFLMKNRHLWLRSPRQRAIMVIRNRIIKSVRDFFNNKDFMLVDAPIFTPAACEGTTNLFETDYFDQKAYLSQSGQLYMEAAAMAYGNVYCFGPTFRAEKSKTRRHLTEFWMVEPEMAFCNIEQDMDMAEEFVEYIVQQVVDHCKDELETLERDVSKLENVKRPFPRISYDEAIEILHKKGNDTPWGEDFGGDEETLISQEFDRPVMIHRYPMECKAFYMKQDEQNPKVAKCVDMIAPEGYGEIIGGGQREDNLDILLAKIKEHGLPEEAFDWYLDLRKYGSVEHAGFGLGIERTVAWVCGLHHVRETIPFARLMDRIRP